MKYAFLEAPISCGSPTRGAELAYTALLKHGLKEKFPNCATYPMDYTEPCSEYPENLKHLDTVVKVSRSLYDHTLDAFSKHYFPVIIGGDHSISMGSIDAVSEVYSMDKTAVLYIDAHADINTEKTTVTGYIHGMDLAQACGYCTDDLMVGMYYQHIRPENIYIVSGRSIDPPEEVLIQEKHVNLFRNADIKQEGFAKVLERIQQSLKGKFVHISLDVDALDPKEFSSTGYHIPDGLSIDEVKAILKETFAQQNVVSMDLVEYNPTMDIDGKDRDTVFSFLSCLP